MGRKFYICRKPKSMKHFKTLAILCLFFYIPFTGKAWGVLGHRIVGEIADSYLTKHTRKEIQQILGTESVAIASNWPDFIKSDPAFKYLTPWHYDDVRGGMNFDQFSNLLATDTSANAFNKINFLVNELKNNRQNLSAETKQLYLRLLIHIVGDVHQPLHVGHTDDKGGNSIKVLWFSDSVNLHQIWDGKLIDFQQLSYTEYAAAINHTTKDQRKLWQSQSLTQWMWDSYSLAEKVYADVKPGQKLSYDYNFKFIGALNDRLLRGGVHLAGLLNDIFGERNADFHDHHNKRKSDQS